MKQLVLYVHKIMTHDDKIFFRITCNQKHDPVWAKWDEERLEAARPIALSSDLSELLRKVSSFDTFRMVFTNEDYFFGSNPFNSTVKNFLDTTLPISDKEIMFWRKVIINIQNNK